jgi:glycosyltransferase involved in cell wall biosynthesis
VNYIKSKLGKDVDIVITRSNSIVNSPRVRKIAGSLKNKYRTRVVGWNREGISPEKSRVFITDLDLLNFRGPIGRTILVLYLPLFWIYLFAKLVKYQPSIVHACDLDTLPPSLIFKVLFRKTLIFDVCDRYALSKISPRRKLLYSFVNWMEEYLGQKADFMINVSEKRAGTFNRKPRKSGIVMNCADDSLKALVKINSKYRPSENDCNNDFTLVYTGNIVRKRGLEQVRIAIRNMDNVRLIMAGAATDQEFLSDLMMQKNIKYCGQLSFQEALGLESIADVMVILYDPEIPNNRYANPNKLFEAMMFGIPVITNVVEEVVEETNCGLLVEYRDIEQIKKAIIVLLGDPKLRRKLGENGRIAFEKHYNWSVMEKTLFDIYGSLQKNSKL